MSLRRHRKAVFIGLGAATAIFAIAMNVSWLVITWSGGVRLVLGAILFLIIIGGVLLNTTFLVREVRRNEQHNNFINAVTHELKTPVASMRLYLETLKTRPVDEAKRQQFYDIMLADSERLLYTIEQVLRRSHLRPQDRTGARGTARRHRAKPRHRLLAPSPARHGRDVHQSLARRRERHRARRPRRTPHGAVESAG